MKLQGWMVSPSPVGGKDVMSPPPAYQLKGQPKLAFIHTCTVCVELLVNCNLQTSTVSVWNPTQYTLQYCTFYTAHSIYITALHNTYNVQYTTLVIYCMYTAKHSKDVYCMHSCTLFTSTHTIEPCQ